MDYLQPNSNVKEVEENSKGEEAQVSILLPDEPIRATLLSELDNSALPESYAAIEEAINTDLEKIDVIAKDADRPGSDVKIESDSFSEEDLTTSSSDNPKFPKPESAANQNDSALEEDEGGEEKDDPPNKKQKQQETVTVKEEEEPEQVLPSEAMVVEEAATPVTITTKKSKSKRKNKNVWVTKSTRKGKKKSKAIKMRSN